MPGALPPRPHTFSAEATDHSRKTDTLPQPTPCGCQPGPNKKVTWLHSRWLASRALDSEQTREEQAPVYSDAARPVCGSGTHHTRQAVQ